jgi:hypothetical protein
MKLLLLLALFCAMFVEGNLRGDHDQDGDGDESRTLKKCKSGGTFAKLQSVAHGVPDAVAFSW